MRRLDHPRLRSYGAGRPREVHPHDGGIHRRIDAIARGTQRFGSAPCDVEYGIRDVESFEGKSGTAGDESPRFGDDGVSIGQTVVILGLDQQKPHADEGRVLHRGDDDAEQDPGRERDCWSRRDPCVLTNFEADADPPDIEEEVA